MNELYVTSHSLHQTMPCALHWMHILSMQSMQYWPSPAKGYSYADAYLLSLMMSSSPPLCFILWWLGRPCNHLFHPDCVRPWMKTHNTCPVCRSETLSHRLLIRIIIIIIIIIPLSFSLSLSLALFSLSLSLSLALSLSESDGMPQLSCNVCSRYHHQRYSWIGSKLPHLRWRAQFRYDVTGTSYHQTTLDTKKRWQRKKRRNTKRQSWRNCTVECMAEQELCRVRSHPVG